MRNKRLVIKQRVQCQIISVFLDIILVSILVSPIIISGKENTNPLSKIIIVNWDGSGDYITIQDGIDAAYDGDIVLVADGTYYENIIVDKSIELLGESRENTVIDGSGNDDVVYVDADSMKISGFTIQNSGEENIGIWVDSDSDYNIFSDNIITNNGYGIYLGDEYYFGSLENNISGNVITENVVGIKLGDYSEGATVSENTIAHNTLMGILLAESTIRNNIIGNTFTNNCYGITIYSGAIDNTIALNTIESSECYGLTNFGYATLIYHNNFHNINAYGNAYDEGYDTTWDDGYPSGGNYWSDFDEPSEGAWDFDKNGIADEPYNIPGDGDNQDLYPFMEPNGWLQTPNHSPIANFTYTPENPTPNDTIQFTDTSTDLDGEIISWWWDFGDENYSSRQNPRHCYYEEGIYNVSLTVWDNNGANDTIIKIITIIIPNKPPDMPSQPDGPTYGITNTTYTFTTNTKDPENQLLYYLFLWGDNTTSGWLGPFPSGEKINAFNSWNESGTYQIRVKAKDTHGAESNWSRPHAIILREISTGSSISNSGYSESSKEDETKNDKTIVDDLIGK